MRRGRPGGFACWPPHHLLTTRPTPPSFPTSASPTTFTAWPTPRHTNRAWAIRRSSSLRLQRHQVLFGVVLSPRFFVGGSLALVSFGARWVLPGTQALRCYRAACIRDKEPREIQEIGWFRVPAAGFCCWCGRGACLRVFCEDFSLSAVLAIASASVGAHAVRNSCGLYELQLALTDTDVWKVYLFPHQFLLMARALSRQPHVTAAT